MIWLLTFPVLFSQTTVWTENVQVMLLATNTSLMIHMTELLYVELGHRPQFVDAILYLTSGQADGTALQLKCKLFKLTSYR